MALDNPNNANLILRDPFVVSGSYGYSPAGDRPAGGVTSNANESQTSSSVDSQSQSGHIYPWTPNWTPSLTVPSCYDNQPSHSKVESGRAKTESNEIYPWSLHWTPKPSTISNADVASLSQSRQKGDARAGAALSVYQEWMVDAPALTPFMAHAMGLTTSPYANQKQFAYNHVASVTASCQLDQGGAAK